jgi:hypothetical protein
MIWLTFAQLAPNFPNSHLSAHKNFAKLAKLAQLALAKFPRELSMPSFN